MASLRHIFSKLSIEPVTLRATRSILLPLICKPQINHMNMHTSLVRDAGHSKWQNIKDTKMSKDLKRSIVNSKICMQIKLSLQKGASSEPANNAALARAIRFAQAASVPNSTIANTIKAGKASAANAVVHSLVYTRGNNCYLVVDVLTDNVKRTRGEINGALRKTGFKAERILQPEEIFYTKGIIIVEKGQGQTFETAMDHGIELGAEDVREEAEDNVFVFECQKMQMDKMSQELTDLKYNITFTEVEKHDLLVSQPTQEISEKAELSIEKLEAIDCVVDTYANCTQNI